MASCGNDLGEAQVFITHLLGAMLGAGFQSPGLTCAYNQAIRQRRVVGTKFGGHTRKERGGGRLQLGRVGIRKDFSGDDA